MASASTAVKPSADVVDSRRTLEGQSAAVVKWVGDHLGTLANAVLVVVVAFGLYNDLFRHNETKLFELRADTPPPEYLYLDAERTLAYLGQIEGGLSDSEKRKESLQSEATASLKSPGADLATARRHEQSIEEVVTPRSTDRFFKLLRKLRAGRDEGDGDRSPWIVDVDARVPDHAAFLKLLDGMQKIREGHFVRISNARLLLPDYAAVIRRIRYATQYVYPYKSASLFTAPAAAAFAAPDSAQLREDVKAYLDLLGLDPTLPFVVPTWSPGKLGRRVVFFVPARYLAIVDNQRLLAGNLTVVGKVIYKDLRAAGKRCTSRPVQPCKYVDVQTFSTFAPALEQARQSVLSVLTIPPDRGSLDQAVLQSVSFETPIVVVLPVAIYQ
jgi:hypothetical protein